MCSYTVLPRGELGHADLSTICFYKSTCVYVDRSTDVMCTVLVSVRLHVSVCLCLCTSLSLSLSLCVYVCVCVCLRTCMCVQDQGNHKCMVKSILDYLVGDVYLAGIEMNFLLWSLLCGINFYIIRFACEGVVVTDMN